MQIRTDTVVSEPGQSVCNIPGEPLASLVRLGSLAEASSVGPAADGHADLGALIEESADLAERLERLVLSSGLGSEEGRVGKSSDDVGNASNLRLGRRVGGVPLVKVEDVVGRGGGNSGQSRSSKDERGTHGE